MKKKELFKALDVLRIRYEPIGLNANASPRMYRIECGGKHWGTYFEETREIKFWNEVTYITHLDDYIYDAGQETTILNLEFLTVEKILENYNKARTAKNRYLKNKLIFDIMKESEKPFE